MPNWGLTRDKGGYVYIVTNKRFGTLYTGVSNSVISRVADHREGERPGFTKKYGLTRLVYFEAFEDIRDAIQRETSIKRWPRQWKINLIEQVNPQWLDLFPALVDPPHSREWRERLKKDSPT